MASIEVRELEFGRGADFTLGPLSLDLASGSRTALVGPSGCGKTTLLRCLAGLETPRAGTIAIDGRIVYAPDIIVPPDARRIGFVFQAGALWPHKSALAHLRFVAPKLGRKGARALLAKVGLEGYEKRHPSELSGGERQRLALARALATLPDILVLDEPLASVDVHLRDELALLVRKLTEERALTLIVVTHDRDEALAMADDIVVLREGQVVESGPAREILRAPRTSFAASFLCRASVWPTEELASERGPLLRTPFGDFDRNGAAPGPLAMVVLPGEARVVEAAGERTAAARVLRVLPRGDRSLVTVEVEGRTMEVEVSGDVTGGIPGGVARELWIEVPAEPRFLVPDRARSSQREKTKVAKEPKEAAQPTTQPKQELDS